MSEQYDDLPAPAVVFPGASERPESAYRTAHDLLARRAPREALEILDPALEQEPTNKGLRALRETRYPDDIDVLGYVEDEEKDDLYRRASAFVFPSAYEGFGLPVLEAMAHRCPVVAYDNSSIPEVAGDAAVLVAEPGPAPLAGAIGSLLDDPQRRSALVAAGVERVRLFSWERCAERTLAELRA